MRNFRYTRNLLMSLIALVPLTTVIAAPEDPLFMVVHESLDSDMLKSINRDSGTSVAVIEAFSADNNAYAVFEASDEQSLRNFLAGQDLSVSVIKPILDINSPVRGGGKHAGDIPREGHQTYVIQRKIPGVGLLPDEKKQAISKGSNRVIEEIGSAIEWDHSYLTDEGTFCVYRATDEEIVLEHGRRIGPEIISIDLVQVEDVAEVR